MKGLFVAGAFCAFLDPSAIPAELPWHGGAEEKPLCLSAWVENNGNGGRAVNSAVPPGPAGALHSQWPRPSRESQLGLWQQQPPHLGALGPLFPTPLFLRFVCNGHFPQQLSIYLFISYIQYTLKHLFIYLFISFIIFLNWDFMLSFVSCLISRLHFVSCPWLLKSHFF